jgi:LAS superfamily LD-carboxypeptidase LdcB
VVKYPSKTLVIPKELRTVENGRLDEGTLANIKCGGKMWKWAALSFNMMFDTAKKDGIVFKNEGDYRPYARQLAMFKDRYSLVDEGRKPQVIRKFEGKVWYLKKRKSPSATPGTSNHGLGLAIDLEVKDPKVLAWLCANASKYGFYLQGSDPSHPEFEAWHWQYCFGDNPPAIVQAAVKNYVEALKNRG